MTKSTSRKQKSTNNSHKGETEPRRQKGAPSTSNKSKAKHEKDDSSGAEKNTTKKQGNSI
ncbi:hypothetical protein [Longitalea arenae]|uniref:hypothetical protein n=1 Tax=Longitalea arenae TaxID=2812558 RepID=UPI00196763E9|nr:hypothetical protein [Longitalea arenae]